MVHSSGILAKNINIGTSLAVQWLRACFQCRGCSFNRWSGNWDAISCAAWQNKSSDAGAQLGPIKLASLGKRPMSQCFSTQVMLTSRIKTPRRLSSFQCALTCVVSFVSWLSCLLISGQSKTQSLGLFPGTRAIQDIPLCRLSSYYVICVIWWFLCLAINENHPGSF